FLHRCSEEHLETFTRILTHNENGKPRLSSTLLRNQTFQAMAGHPERYRRDWQLIAGELQHFGGDSIANTLRRHGKFYREILLDVCKRLKIKADKHTSTPEIELHLLEHFLEHSWKKMDDRQKADFFTAVECRVNDHKALLPHLLQTNKLAQGVNHLLEIRLAKILRTHAAVSVIGHGLVRGAGLGGPLGAAFNGVKAVSGSAYHVTIPAVLYIACLRQMTSLYQVKNEIGEKYPARS
ncbi:acidic protein MsyB, partial [Klebsiella michiganensis]